MMIARVSIIFACTVFLAGCGKSKSPATTLSEVTKIETVFVKGDPNQLVEGAQSNSLSFINTSNVLLLNEFSLSHVTQFTEKEEIVTKEDTESESAEEGNEPTETDETERAKSRLYSFVKNGREYSYESPATELKLIFLETEGELNLASLRVPGENLNLRPIHYSMKKSGDAFSILAEYNEGEQYSGKVVIAFTFTRKSEAKKIPTTSAVYKYIFGAGIKVPWEQKQNLEISICGQQSEKVEKAYRDGIAQWSEVLNGRLNVSVKMLASYPPFSDLNTNCIYTVKNYQTIYGNRFINAASTIAKGNLFKGNIIDADIMVWVKEHEKVGITLEQSKNLQLVTAHEVGHLLGLHHQFDKSIKSIMGYEGYEFISEYDQEAIARLYPKL